MNVNEATAFVLNNLLVIAAGGLLAAWMAWKFWQKVDSIIRSIPDWNMFLFWAGKTLGVVLVLFIVGALIYNKINAAVVAAANSPSVQQSGQALVEVGAKVDQLIGWVPSDGGGGSLLQNASMDIAGAVNLLEPVAASAPVEAAAAPATTLEMKPLADMFVAAQVNMATNQATTAPTGEYIVQGGDSLSKIAAKLGVDVRALCKANNLPDCNILRRGQRLIVPAAGLPALEGDLNRRVAAVINAPRVTTPQTVYHAPKLNQSYIPPTWKTIEEGEMSVGEPANMSTTNNQVFASFPTN